MQEVVPTGPENSEIIFPASLRMDWGCSTPNKQCKELPLSARERDASSKEPEYVLLLIMRRMEIIVSLMLSLSEILRQK